jgi:Fanconi anemia group M protein
MLLIEGDGTFSSRNINRRAIFGALATIGLNFNIPIMFTRDPGESAEFMDVVLSKEIKKDVQGSNKKAGSGSNEDPRISVLSGFPGISSVIAKRLMDTFGSLSQVFNASVDDLKKVEGIGPARAREIYGLIHLGNEA